MKKLISVFIVMAFLLAGCSSNSDLTSTASVVNSDVSTITDTTKLTLSDAQIESLGAKYYPAQFKTSKAIPMTWETVFDFTQELNMYKQRELCACVYVTVIGTTTGELSHKEGTLEGMTYYELKIDKVVTGDLKEGQTSVVVVYGYYDESTKSWVDTHPNFVPLKAGDKFLTVLYSGGVGGVADVKVTSYFIEPFNGYVEEINGKTYLAYRSSPDIQASALGKSLGKESLFDVKTVPSKMYEDKTEEIAFVDPAVMEQIIKDLLA